MKKLEGSSNMKVRTITTSLFNTIVVLQNGEAFCCGKFDYHSNEKISKGKYRTLTKIKTEKKIIDACIGFDFIALLESSGEVFICGENYDYEMKIFKQFCENKFKKIWSINTGIIGEKDHGKILYLQTEPDNKDFYKRGNLVSLDTFEKNKITLMNRFVI